MVIGIDCSRAFAEERTGTENYSYHVINEMLQLPEAKKHFFVLFIRPKANLSSLGKRNNILVCPIKYRYLWTQWGLAKATWQKYAVQSEMRGIEVLWVPAHTLPIFRRGVGEKLTTVVTIHGLEYMWLPEYRNRLQRWYLPLSTYYAAHKADRLIAVSEHTKQDLINETGIDTKKISVIYEGVENKSIIQNEDLSKKTWEKYGLQRGKYVLFVGTASPRKNLVSLVRAFEKAELPAGYKLVISGGMGWMNNDLWREIGESPAIERIIVTGRVGESELEALYLGAGMYVQPSWTEGFGLPPLEAMKAGVPVVVSNGGALPEVVGNAGIVVPLDDAFVPKLAETMKKIANQQQLRTKLIGAGRARIKQLTWEKAAKATLKVLLYRL